MKQGPSFFRPLLACAAAAILLALGGCASQSSNPFAPESPLAAGVVRQWEVELGRPDLLKDPRWATDAGRNELVHKLIFLCDYRFSRYEASLVLGKAWRDSVIDEVIFGLSTAVSLGTDAGASKVLSAVAGGLAFSRANYEKNFLQSQAMPVLLRKMRALRLEKYHEITARLDLPASRYTVYEAIIDLLDYYNRGTVLRALEAIDEDTTLQEFQLKGGTIKMPPRAETRTERFGRFKSETIKTRTVTLTRAKPPEPILPTSVHADDPVIQARNKRLRDAFEFLSPDEAKAVLIARVPDFKPDPSQDTRALLAAKVLAAADISIGADGAVRTLASRRANAWDDASLKRLEDAYEKFLPMPPKPAAAPAGAPFLFPPKRL